MRAKAHHLGESESLLFLPLKKKKKDLGEDFPGSPVVTNPPANAGDRILSLVGGLRVTPATEQLNL